AVNILPRIGYGGDMWELRVDLLSPFTPLKDTNVPPTSYIKQQFDLLRSVSSHPILFTIRTVAQGGKFPDDAADEATELMELALTLQCDYLDIEVTWPADVIERVVQGKGSTKLVGSFHDWSGDLRWTDELVQCKYDFMCTFPGNPCGFLIIDIPKISIQAKDIYDCFEM